MTLDRVFPNSTDSSSLPDGAVSKHNKTIPTNSTHHTPKNHTNSSSTHDTTGRDKPTDTDANSSTKAKDDKTKKTP